MLIHLDGMEFLVVYHEEERATRDYPGADAYVELEYNSDGNPEVCIEDEEEFLESGHSLDDDMNEVFDRLYDKILVKAEKDYNDPY